MTTIQTIREQLKSAMREHNQVALDTLRSVLSGCTTEALNLGLTPQDELSDEQALVVIKKLIKQRKDSIEQYENGGRPELAQSEKDQLAVLEQFQPAQMSEDKIREICIRKKEELGITDKAKAGILVGAAMKEIAGAADGSTVKKVIDTLFV